MDWMKGENGERMKRLKNYLLQMENSTTTYREMYEGRIVIPAHTPGNESDFSEFSNDNVYWYKDYSMALEMTNKFALDKPTVEWRIPAALLGISEPSLAVADHCYREFLPYLEALNEELFNRNRTPEENGKYYFVVPRGEILVRNTAYFATCPQKDYIIRSSNVIVHYEDASELMPQLCVCFRLQVQLPRKKIKKAIQMLCKDLPEAIDFFVAGFSKTKEKEVEALARKQSELRNWLKNSDYCAFLANGSILPRDAKTGGALAGAIPFQAPKEDEIEACGVKGLGIRKGITVITGGGYSGKSTILDTISAGIYDHILGDGRELCITDEDAMTISAEDGRSIQNINISPFIRWIPGGNTTDFSTEHASGSTSQAANILEAVDYGATLLLIDEDKSATNFMIRDDRMKELIQKEPITPFTERVNELYQACGVSTVLVIGGSGEYLSIADCVYMMEEYRIFDVTKRAKALCPTKSEKSPAPADWQQKRQLLTEGFNSYPKDGGSEKLAVPDIGFIFIGDEKIDTRALHNICGNDQRTAMAFILRKLEVRQNEAFVDFSNQLKLLYEEMDEQGLDLVYSGIFTECDRFLARPRKLEMLALVSRMRNIRYSNPNKLE